MAIISAAEADKRVKAGADLLDREVGVTWRDKIDVSTLNMTSSYSCVLGQLYGHYPTGLDKLSLSDDVTAYSHGFNSTYDEDPGNAVTKAAWMRILTAEVGAIFKGSSWNCAYEALQILKMLRIDGESHFVVRPGTIENGLFVASRYLEVQVYRASAIFRIYKRYTPVPVGRIVKFNDGSIYYVNKEARAWRIDSETAVWSDFTRLVDEKGAATIHKTALGAEFDCATA